MVPIGDDAGVTSVASGLPRRALGKFRGDAVVSSGPPTEGMHPDVEALSPPIARIPGGNGAGVRLLVSNGGDVVFETEIRRADRGWLGRSIAATLRFPSTKAPADHAVRAATILLLRHLAAGKEGSWDVLTIQAPAFADEIRLAACSFAASMDLGCDMPPAGDGGGEVRIRSAGRRGAIAHLVGAIPRGARVGTWLRGIHYRLRTRSQLAWRRIGAGSPEIDMVLPLPVPAARLIAAPAGLSFEEVRHEAVLRHPRRFASYGTDVDHRVARGDRCFAGAIGGRVVFRMWLCTDADFIARRSPRLAAYGRAGYVYDSHTDPDWRGRSIRGASLHWVSKHMSDSLDYLVLSVLPTNLASIRAARKAGFMAIDERDAAADEKPDLAAQH